MIPTVVMGIGTSGDAAGIPACGVLRHPRRPPHPFASSPPLIPRAQGVGSASTGGVEPRADAGSARSEDLADVPDDGDCQERPDHDDERGVVPALRVVGPPEPLERVLDLWAGMSDPELAALFDNP